MTDPKKLAEEAKWLADAYGGGPCVEGCYGDLRTAFHASIDQLSALAEDGRKLLDEALAHMFGNTDWRDRVRAALSTGEPK
jgi:hypothetical protein